MLQTKQTLFSQGGFSMTWHDQLNADPLPWLLESQSPGVRYLALRDLLDLPPTDPELVAARTLAHRQGPIAGILAAMNPAGYWDTPGPGYNPKYRSTVWSLISLAQLGACIHQDERIATACDTLLEHAFNPGGQFSASGPPSGTADCLQGNLCWALTQLGCTDPRLAKAFDWMARTVTGEGIAPLKDKHAAVRYYAGKCGALFACGANNKLPCAWGAVKVLLALGCLPIEKRTPVIENAIRQGVDFLFSVDPATAAYPSGYSDKPSQSWWKFSFPVFYVTDLLQVVEALTTLGYAHDSRLANAIDLIHSKQDSHGRWLLEYDYAGKMWVEFGGKKLPNKWVSLRVLRVLKALG
jgi:hypothetical protein